MKAKKVMRFGYDGSGDWLLPFDEKLLLAMAKAIDKKSPHIVLPKLREICEKRKKDIVGSLFELQRTIFHNHHKGQVRDFKASFKKVVKLFQKTEKEFLLVKDEAFMSSNLYGAFGNLKNKGLKNPVVEWRLIPEQIRKNIEFLSQLEREFKAQNKAGRPRILEDTARYIKVIAEIYHEASGEKPAFSKLHKVKSKKESSTSPSMYFCELAMQVVMQDKKPFSLSTFENACEIVAARNKKSKKLVKF